jgi:hypothetical protein
MTAAVLPVHTSLNTSQRQRLTTTNRSLSETTPFNILTGSLEMDFVQTLDPSKLVLAGTVRRNSWNALEGPRIFSLGFMMSLRGILQGLSFLLSLAATPPYNLPIFLFGCYAQEATEASQSLQIVSATWDTLHCIDETRYTSVLSVVA